MMGLLFIYLLMKDVNDTWVETAVKEYAGGVRMVKGLSIIRK